MCGSLTGNTVKQDSRFFLIELEKRMAATSSTLGFCMFHDGDDGGVGGGDDDDAGGGGEENDEAENANPVMLCSLRSKPS